MAPERVAVRSSEPTYARAAAAADVPVRIAVLMPPKSRMTIWSVGARVLIVDDHAGFRSGVRRLLELEGYTVVGEAENGASALARVGELRPELVLLDVYLPDLDGFEVARQLSAMSEPPAVVLTSSYDRTELEPLVAGSGAWGFVAKHELSRAAIEELLR